MGYDAEYMVCTSECPWRAPLYVDDHTPNEIRRLVMGLMVAEALTHVKATGHVVASRWARGESLGYRVAILPDRLTLDVLAENGVIPHPRG